jgi:hypothetical protein
MAKGYRLVDRDQVFLLPPDMREWLPAGHAVYLVIDVVGDHLDTSVFHARRRTGGAGAAGYDPDMLLTVLVLCARLGMGRLGTVALDGTKVAASASKAANRAEKRLRELAAEAVVAHAAADAAEDELFGEGRRGDELPPDAGAWSPRRRGERIAEALAQLEAERQAAEAGQRAKAQEFRDRQRTGQRTGPGPVSAAVELAQENLARVIAARRAQLARLEQRHAGKPRAGRLAGVEDYCRSGRLPPRWNGPASGLLRRSAGRRRRPGRGRCGTSPTRTRG